MKVSLLIGHQPDPLSIKNPGRGVHKRDRSVSMRPRTWGGVPERPKGSDCKSDGSAFEGSNPSPSTIQVRTIRSCPVEGFPSGQRDQTVNLTALPSKVRILLPPPSFREPGLVPGFRFLPSTNPLLLQKREARPPVNIARLTPNLLAAVKQVGQGDGPQASVLSSAPLTG